MNHFEEMMQRLDAAEFSERNGENEEEVTRNLLFAIAHGLVAANERLEAVLADDIADSAFQHA